jgi:hypothetical protein
MRVLVTRPLLGRLAGIVTVGVVSAAPPTVTDAFGLAGVADPHPARTVITASGASSAAAKRRMEVLE